jgi:mono/diheme cytochrome c family protein
MHRLTWFLTGAITIILVGGAGSFLFLKAGAAGFSTAAQPSPLERWAARQARAMAMPANARDQANPVPDSPEILAEARAHWADHCALCHANDGTGDTVMGKHMYPPAPDMRKAETQKLTDGELFYIIQNGIRLTGMPGWASGSEHDAEDSWKLVRFIRHLPALTFEERKEMEKLNPKSPDELKEEEEEEKFLKGESTDEPQEHHHHH